MDVAGRCTTHVRSNTGNSREYLMPPRLPPELSLVLSRCRERLEQIYGTQFRGLVLHGSAARDNVDPESDIDLLVLLDEPFDFFREVKRVVDTLYPVQLESSRLISARPARAREYREGRIQLYRNALREGVEV